MIGSAEMQMKLLRRQEVEELVGISRSTLYTMISEGRFPKQVQISTRAVRWRRSDVIEWMRNLEKAE